MHMFNSGNVVSGNTWLFSIELWLPKQSELQLSISLQDLQLHTGQRVQEANTWCGSVKAATDGGLGWFQQITVNKRHPIGGSNSRPAVGLKDSTLTQAVTCDSVHHLKRHTALKDYLFSVKSSWWLLAVAKVIVLSGNLLWRYRFCTTF